MTSPADQRRYRPQQPSPEQERQIADALERLGSSVNDPSAPEVPADPSPPAAP